MIKLKLNMSSSCEESGDRVEEVPTNSDTIEEASPKKRKADSEPNNHVKPKRRRRGGKRKHKKVSTSNNNAARENEAESPPWDSDEDLSCSVDTFSDVVLRPIVPKAPENSTQFIMDDHDECRLYMSFENPKNYFQELRSREGYEDVIEPEEEDAAYRDIDYEYESPQDFDNTAYYDREFEQSYNNNRFEELLRRPRAELISSLQDLDFRIKVMEDDLILRDPNSYLEKLQSQLLALQEENVTLRAFNAQLNDLVSRTETDEQLHDESVQTNTSSSYSEETNHNTSDTCDTSSDDKPCETSDEVNECDDDGNVFDTSSDNKPCDTSGEVNECDDDSNVCGSSSDDRPCDISGVDECNNDGSVCDTCSDNKRRDTLDIPNDCNKLSPTKVYEPTVVVTDENHLDSTNQCIHICASPVLSPHFDMFLNETIPSAEFITKKSISEDHVDGDVPVI